MLLLPWNECLFVLFFTFQITTISIYSRNVRYGLIMCYCTWWFPYIWASIFLVLFFVLFFASKKCTWYLFLPAASFRFRFLFLLKILGPVFWNMVEILFLSKPSENYFFFHSSSYLVAFFWFGWWNSVLGLFLFWFFISFLPCLLLFSFFFPPLAFFPFGWPYFSLVWWHWSLGIFLLSRVFFFFLRQWWYKGKLKAFWWSNA